MKFALEGLLVYDESKKRFEMSIEKRLDWITMVIVGYLCINYHIVVFIVMSCLRCFFRLKRQWTGRITLFKDRFCPILFKFCKRWWIFSRTLLLCLRTSYGHLLKQNHLSWSMLFTEHSCCFHLVLITEKELRMAVLFQGISGLFYHAIYDLQEKRTPTQGLKNIKSLSPFLLHPNTQLKKDAVDSLCSRVSSLYHLLGILTCGF